MAWMNCSVSLELTTVASQDSLSGALDRVSAVYKDFPGTCWIVYWNRIRRSLNRNALGGNRSKLFCPKSGTRGL